MLTSSRLAEAAGLASLLHVELHPTPVKNQRKRRTAPGSGGQSPPADSSDGAIKKTSAELHFSNGFTTYLCVFQSWPTRGLSTAQREEKGGRWCGVTYVTSHVSSSSSLLSSSKIQHWVKQQDGSLPIWKWESIPLLPHKPSEGVCVAFLHYLLYSSIYVLS